MNSVVTLEGNLDKVIQGESIFGFRRDIEERSSQNQPKAFEFEPPGRALPSLKARMRPFNINGCFAWLHTRLDDLGSDVAVMIFPGLMLDALTAHHSLRVFADEFAAAGYPTMRMDYPGTGDSSDVAEGGADIKNHWDVWLKSTNEGINWLRRSTGATRIVLCGLRFGAALATMVSASRDDIVGLVLLEPVLRGRPYLRQVWIESKLLDGRVPPLQDGLDFDGLRLSAETVQSIAELDLQRAKLRAGLRVSIFSQSESEALSKCTLSWINGGVDVVRADFSGLAPLLCNSTPRPATPADSTNIIKWMTQAFPAQTGQAVAIFPFRIPTLQTPAYIEIPLGFGQNGQLFGMLCIPTHRNSDAVVVTVNAGHNPHYGSGRFGVELARRLATEGVASFRIDFSGTGDSRGPPDKDKLLTPLFDLDRSSEISAAIDILLRMGFGKFVLCGSCSGAYHAFHAALIDTRVEGLFLFNFPQFIWESENTLLFNRHKTFPLRHYLKKLFEVGIWKQLIAGKLGHRFREGIVRAQAERLYEQFQKTLFLRSKKFLGRAESNPYSHRASPFSHRAIATLARRNVETTFLFGPAEPGFHAIETDFGPRAVGLRKFEGVSAQIIPEFDHNLKRREARKIAADVMVNFFQRRTGSMSAHGIRIHDADRIIKF